MQFKISASLLACDFLHLADEVKRAENAGCDMLHCDIMDGLYVPNISFGFDIVKKIHSITSLPLDVHMMTAVPQHYIDVLADAGAASITLHHDVMQEKEMISTLKSIRALGIKTAVSLKPHFPAEDAFKFIPYCDMILVMTVDPGFGGQKFMWDMLPKIRELREYVEHGGYDCSIQADGGIASDTIGECAKAGVDNFVVGSASFKADDMTFAVKQLKQLAYDAYSEGNSED